MTWQPKSSAPAYFSLADAFIALVTGDPIWGWLVDWATLVPNLGQNTAEFCSAGPPGTVDLSVMFGPSPPDRSPMATAAKLAVIGAGLFVDAKDRVFAAYCEQPPVDPTGWGQPIYVTVGPGNTPTGQVIVPVPAGATGVRIHLISAPEVNNSDNLLQTFWQSSGDVWSPIGSWRGANNFQPDPGHTVHWSGTAVNIDLNPYDTSGSYSMSLEFDGVGSGVIEHVATAQPQPEGAVSPLSAVPATLDGIAAEVARLEFKLDFIMPLLQGVAGATIDLGGATSDPTDLAPDTPVDVLDAVGCIIQVSGVPASRSLDFGNPQNVVKLGHVNLGTASAWYPSVWLTHSPMVIRPFPVGVTRVTVTDLPPGVTATIQMISRSK